MSESELMRDVWSAPVECPHGTYMHAYAETRYPFWFGSVLRKYQVRTCRMCGRVEYREHAVEPMRDGGPCTPIGWRDYGPGGWREVYAQRVGR